MKQGEMRRQEMPGRYLTAPSARKKDGGRQVRKAGKWLLIAVLVCWDGLLLYMIVRCLIHAVYGGLFIAIVSIYLGYQLKEE